MGVGINKAETVKLKENIKRGARGVWRRLRYHPQLLHLFRRPLDESRFNVYSQNGEDGIIAEIFRRIGISAGWLVEFGAWDGIYLSNTYRIIQQHETFQAVYIEGDADKFNDLRCTAKSLSGRLIPIHAFVQAKGELSLDNILFQTPLPSDFELLSIDVDGMDYQIWEALQRYSPKIVVIEINSSIPPDEEQIHDDSRQGSSFKSTLRLGQTKGYTCVCHTGNLIFVRNEVMLRIGLNKKYLEHPELLFDPAWLKSEALAKVY